MSQIISLLKAKIHSANNSYRNGKIELKNSIKSANKSLKKLFLGKTKQLKRKDLYRKSAYEESKRV